MCRPGRPRGLTSDQQELCVNILFEKRWIFCNRRSHDGVRYATRILLKRRGLEQKIKIFLFKNCLNFCGVLSKLVQCKRITNGVCAGAIGQFCVVVFFFSRKIAILGFNTIWMTLRIFSFYLKELTWKLAKIWKPVETIKLPSYFSFPT